MSAPRRPRSGSTGRRVVPARRGSRSPRGPRRRRRTGGRWNGSAARSRPAGVAEPACSAGACGWRRRAGRRRCAARRGGTAAAGTAASRVRAGRMGRPAPARTSACPARSSPRGSSHPAAGLMPPNAGQHPPRVRTRAGPAARLRPPPPAVAEARRWARRRRRALQPAPTGPAGRTLRSVHGRKAPPRSVAPAEGAPRRPRTVVSLRRGGSSVGPSGRAAAPGARWWTARPASPSRRAPARLQGVPACGRPGAWRHPARRPSR